MAITANDLTAQVMLELSRDDCRLWRVNAGVSWQGRVVERTASRLVLSPYYAVKLAPIGFPDLAGFSAPCVFTGIEVKFGRDRVRPEQQSFIDMILEAGGRAGIARNLDDAKRIVTMEVQK